MVSGVKSGANAPAAGGGSVMKLWDTSGDL